MSMKRVSQESSIDELTSEGSASCQQDENVKRAKIIPFSDTTFQDLPFELIECILIKAIIMEVRDMKLAKSAWKRKIDPVVDRLRTVCQQWSDILATTFFRNELLRTLDRTAQEVIRFEILHHSPLPIKSWRIATLKDEIFVLGGPSPLDYFINVYDRNNVALVKDVIPLPDKRPHSMTACNVLNCLYLLSNGKAGRGDRYSSVWRIARDPDEKRFVVSRLIKERYLPRPVMCASANGSLILARRQTVNVDAISVYDAAGFLQHTLRLPSEVSELYCLFPTCNGNLVFVQRNSYDKPKLTEVAMNGVVVRQYQSSLGSFAHASNADRNGRILMFDNANRMELLDSEFNRLDFTGPQLDGYQFYNPYELHYNCERDEIHVLANLAAQNYQNRTLTVFQLS